MVNWWAAVLYCTWVCARVPSGGGYARDGETVGDWGVLLSSVSDRWSTLELVVRKGRFASASAGALVRVAAAHQICASCCVLLSAVL